MKKTKKLLIAVLLLALAAGAVVAVKHKRAAVAARPAAGIPPVGVDSLRLAPATVVLTLPVSAEVQALRDAVLASRSSAYVAELTRFEGDRFKKGEVLVRLDMSQAESERLRAEAALAQSRLQQGTVTADLAAAESLVKSETERVARLAKLHEIGGAALEQVQAAEAALAAARARAHSARANAEAYQWLLRASEAQARAARENLRYSVITAPFDGVVSQRLAQPGDLAAPGRPLLKVVDSAAGSRLLVSVPQGLKPVALLVAGQRLPLAPWPRPAWACCPAPGWTPAWRCSAVRRVSWCPAPACWGTMAGRRACCVSLLARWPWPRPPSPPGARRAWPWRRTAWRAPRSCAPARTSSPGCRRGRPCALARRSAGLGLAAGPDRL